MPQPSPADYDDLPYEGHPDPMIHPDRMAVVAWLYGVEAVPPTNARVLEIGCATGAHLIPMAYQLPDSEFVGFDFSPRQIEIAEESAKTVGVKNVRFKVRDIRDDRRDFGTFDYIIAHGIFSWVPAEVQRSLFQLCREHLSPTGVALIDYNVYPGWHLRNFLGDLVGYHEHGTREPGSAIDRALSTLDHVANNLLAPSTPFGQMVMNLQQWAKRQPRNYLAHEFGRGGNRPIMFSEFAERATQSGLDILGDAEICQVLPAHLTQSLDKMFPQDADHYVQREQYLDFLRGREFRRTLLVPNGVEVKRRVIPQQIRRLRASTLARPETSPQGMAFKTPDGAMLRTTNEPFLRALSALCQAGPTGMSCDELYRTASPDAGSPSAGSLEQFCSSILEASAPGIVQLHSHRVNVTGTISNKPLANPLARAAATSGKTTVTSMLHRDWFVDPFDQRLLGYLDGHNDRVALTELMTRYCVSDETILQGSHGKTVQNGGADVASRIASSLEWFARAGLLIA